MEATRGALADVAAAVADIVVSTPDVDAQVPGLAWNVGETVAHTITQVERFTDFIRGVHTPEDDVPDSARGGSPPQRVAAVNAQLIAGFNDRDPQVLSSRLTSAIDEFLTITRERSPREPFRAWEGESDLEAATATLLSELLVHGHDIARASGRPWRVGEAEANLGLRALWALLPGYVDPSATGDVVASVRVAPRGGAPVVITVDHGTARVVTGETRVDATIRGRAPALLLLAFGRVSLARLAARGHLIATGRRPWLALRVPSWFLRP